MNKKEEAKKFRINWQIKALNVKLVGDNVTAGIYTTKEAIQLADDLNLDLVEVAAAQLPPICKIIDFQKFLYDKKKNEKKPDRVETKELRFRPTTDEHDFNFKLKHAQNFLSQGNRVRAYVFFKGREMMFKNQGEDLLKRFAIALEEFGIIEYAPKMEGNKMFMFLRPKKK